MVVDSVLDFMDSRLGQVIIGLVLVSVALTGIQSPANWALTQAPVLGGLTGALPDLVHQAVAALIGVVGLTRLGEAAGVY